ncbi:MAG: (Fe-S)-binding protein [Dehalococcoidia bacterium]
MPLVGHRLLPGTNSKLCSEPTCLAFAFGLGEGTHHLQECIPRGQSEFGDSHQTVLKLLGEGG